LSKVLIRGGGDLGSGVAHLLVSAGHQVAITDRPLPTALRLSVSFCAAILDGTIEIAGVEAVHLLRLEELESAVGQGKIPVWTGDIQHLTAAFVPDALVDARLLGLSDNDLSVDLCDVVIALGPGYVAGQDCHYVIETNRGPDLGRVISSGPTEAHTGTPGEVEGLREERLVRSPASGSLRRLKQIGDRVLAGEAVAEVQGVPAPAMIAGMIRGLKSNGVAVEKGRKIADVDPRMDVSLLKKPSDKAERVGRGVLEALSLSMDTGRETASNL
jgi:xanthine dehydrogenase accessory factor